MKIICGSIVTLFWQKSSGTNKGHGQTNLFKDMRDGAMHPTQLFRYFVRYFIATSCDFRNRKCMRLK